MYGPNIPGFYAISSFTALNFNHQTHPQLSFLLWSRRFILSGAISNCPPLFQKVSDLRGSSSSVISLCLFILFMGFLQQEYWRDFPFPPPVNHVLPELFTVTHPSRAAHSFIELHKSLCHDKAVTHKGVMFKAIKFKKNKLFLEHGAYII